MHIELQMGDDLMIKVFDMDTFQSIWISINTQNGKINIDSYNDIIQDDPTTEHTIYFQEEKE